MLTALLLAAGVAVANSPAAPSRSDASDALDLFFQQAGSGLRNCGRTHSMAKDRAATDECVLAAFAAREPFFVRYDQLGVDSIVAEGLMLSRSKQLSILHFDSYSCNGLSCVRVEPCGSPRISKTKDGIRVACASAYEM